MNQFNFIEILQMVASFLVATAFTLSLYATSLDIRDIMVDKHNYQRWTLLRLWLKTHLYFLANIAITAYYFGHLLMPNEILNQPFLQVFRDVSLFVYIVLRLPHLRGRKGWLEAILRRNWF